jgi:broad specificity phosphatase PhoE
MTGAVVERVTFVRHAATAWSGRRYCGRSDPPLTAEGLAAARELALRLAGEHPSTIASSPATRAVDTAKPVAEAVGVPIELDERWQEADVGQANGLTFEELEARWPNLAKRLAAGFDVDWPGGETTTQVRERVADAWSDLSQRNGDAIVVAHGWSVRQAMALVTGLPTEHLPLLAPAGAVRLVRAGDGATARWRLESVGHPSPRAAPTAGTLAE